MTEQTLVESVPTRDGPDEKDYFLRRAEQHRQLADVAEESGTKHIHLRLVTLYEGRADQIVLVDPD